VTGEAARSDLLASTAFGEELRRQLWSDTPRISSTVRPACSGELKPPMAVRGDTILTTLLTVAG